MAAVSIAKTVEATIRYNIYWKMMLLMCIFFSIITESIFSVNAQATEIRLGNVSGLELKPYEGPIEVFIDGEWGSVARLGEDNVTAKTVCKILGYGYIGFRALKFSYGGQRKLLRLKCVGHETSISECQQEASSFVGGVFYAPGVHCFDHVFTEVRLSGGKKATEGMVQVKMDGRWGRVCSYDKSSGTPLVPHVFLAICRTLGFQNYDLQNGYDYVYDGVELSWLDLSYLSCTGTETHFNQCTFRELTLYQPRCYANLYIGCITELSQYCSSDDVCAGVDNAFCLDNKCACKEGYIHHGLRQCSAAYTFRLFKTSKLFDEGLVEVYTNGHWSLVSGGHLTFNDATAKILCQTLGFGFVGFSTWMYYSSRLNYTGFLAYKVFQCYGSQVDATECFDNIWYEMSLSDGTPVARLHCYDARIVDGATPNSGRIETGIRGQLQSFCEAGIDLQVANITCNTLGYDGAKTLWSGGSNGRSVFSGRVECRGTESSLETCIFIDDTSMNCNESGIAYITCQGGPAKIRPFDKKPNEGYFSYYYKNEWRHIGTAISDITAKTLCRILGFGFESLYRSEGYAVMMKGQIYGGTDFEFMICEGNESDVAECVSGLYAQQKCDDSRCNQPTFRTVALYCADYEIDGIKLVNGLSSREGAVQVLVDGVWGYVCATEWDTIDTNIACKTRGFASGNGFQSVQNQYANVLIGHLQCTGNESHLNQCTYRKKGHYDNLESCSDYVYVTCTSECRQGFYGGQCLQCECNTANTKSCDIVSGECLCVDGWTGNLCSYDIDECATIDVCPNNKVCSNSLGSYTCACELGFMEVEDMCKECSAGNYGRNCSSACNCNTEGSRESLDGRKCDKLTGECECKTAWSGITCDSDVDECLNFTICQSQNTQCTNIVGGYECVCLQGYERQDADGCIPVDSSTDTMMLVIILSSVVGGLTLVVILFFICFCQYRRKLKGAADTNDKPVKGKGFSNHNDTATSIRSTVREEEYDTIGNETDTTDVNALRVRKSKDDGYLDIDLVNRNELVQTHEKDVVRDQINEYLDFNAVEQDDQDLQDEYDYPYKGHKLSERGNVDISGVTRKLPEIPKNSSTTGKEGTKDPYSELKHKKLPEHMYERMGDEHGYLKPVGLGNEKPDEHGYLRPVGLGAGKPVEHGYQKLVGLGNWKPDEHGYQTPVGLGNGKPDQHGYLKPVRLGNGNLGPP